MNCICGYLRTNLPNEGILFILAFYFPKDSISQVTFASQNFRIRKVYSNNFEERRSSYRLMPRKRKNNTGYPDHAIDALARALLPAIQKLFEDENLRKEFEEWQQKRESEKENKT